MLISQRIARQIEAKVDRVFCFPGGTIAPILEELTIPIIVPRTEQGAGYMAIGAARMTNRPEVVLVTSGPGVTNLVTCIADAYFDSVPLVAICGQSSHVRSSKLVRQVGFQEVDTVAIYSEITKLAVTLETATVEAYLPYAFELANDIRRGPVVLDIPMSILREEL